MEEEFVLDFVEKGSITPIDIVEEITGLSLDEIRSFAKIIIINLDIIESK